MDRQAKEVIGIDLGGTVFRRFEGTMYLDRGALRVIRRLVTERFKDRSYIVSKVTPEQKIRALAFLEEEGFHEITGLPKENVYFCAERKDKGPICKNLRITHFVDDRPEVHAHLDSVPHRFLIRGVPEEYQQFKDRLDGVIAVESWKEIEAHLLP